VTDEMPVNSICGECGALGPTKRFLFYESVGALVMRFHRSMNADLCKPCGHRFFWNFTGKTMLLGWWGVISFILSPLILINNTIQFARTLSMDAPPVHSSVPPSPLWILTTAVGLVLIGSIPISFLISLLDTSPAPERQPSIQVPQDEPLPLQDPSPTRRPTTRPQPSSTPSCTSWQRVTAASLNRRLCVYGTVKRWYSTADFATVIRFSETPGDFIFYDPIYTYDEMGPGSCVVATGVIEELGSSLALNIEGELFACD